MGAHIDVLDLVSGLKARGEAFVLATVVRTVSLTAAKAGAKAVIAADGTISGGWIGGGCARGAVIKAAREALADGRTRLVSVQPGDLLEEHHVAAGELRDGVLYAKNSCPSQGTMDVFVEPVLPRPQLFVCGASPVAVAIAELARRMGFFVNVCAPAADHPAFAEADRLIDGLGVPEDSSHVFIVIATQGRGDSEALKAAMKSPARYVAFVGSRKKAAVLKQELAESGGDAGRIAQLHAPAGLDLGGITPEEIALSIVAEMVEVRRRGQREA